MGQLAPLIQTALWVGLASAVLWRFHVPIHGLLVAIRNRIEAGSGVKAGPFEISENLKAQDLRQQRAKAEAEVAEAEGTPRQGNTRRTEDDDLPLEPEPADPSWTDQQAEELFVSSPTSRRFVLRRVFMAEDLALRAIQAKYETPLKRHVTPGHGIGLDAAFSKNGRFYVVEVKYVASISKLPVFRASIVAFGKTLEALDWKDTTLILAVVFARSEDVSNGLKQLQSLRHLIDLDVVIHGYSLPDLQMRFGVDDTTHE